MADVFGVDAQVCRYRAALEVPVLRDLMSAEQRSERVTHFRSRMNPEDEGSRTTKRVREGWFRRVEVVTISGTSEGFTIEPVRGPDGRIDVEASALHARLYHDAIIPDLDDTRRSRQQHVIMRYLRWRKGKTHADHGLGWAEFRANQDLLAKESYRRVRAAEEERD